jgi:hypothetical protein
MAAVMVERPSTQWTDLEPFGRGHDLLTTWAPYRRGGNDTRSPVASVGWTEQLDKATDAEPYWLVMIDREIGRLTRINYIYEKLVQRFYLEQMAMWQLEAKLGRTPGFIRMSVCAICDSIDRAIPEALTRGKR